MIFKAVHWRTVSSKFITIVPSCLQRKKGEPDLSSGHRTFKQQLLVVQGLLEARHTPLEVQCRLAYKAK